MIAKGHDFEMKGYGHPYNKFYRCKKCGYPRWFDSRDYDVALDEIVDLNDFDKEFMRSCEEIIMRIALLGERYRL